ncbi:putative secreted protein (Por secretion system target) [Lutibacter sp. Hel_I_33_5]|uniref:type IX secretion system anionic LPS delivery protein PorZ n=1 Tax=Lutibacter sp. Hel_I_33_5 TaxID=1566289 RepID=UPI0011A8A30F|nr:two-component regulator propeller domain-containing protein [Lutibacter sp. Hel_I_33_5]TVZ56215.1 putative secreted protein (Por secretion system target) [Lutibacter sp. Hel_I_33_5]
MKKIVFFLFFITSSILFSQTDYSDSWEDFFSYNNVKDFVKTNDVIYALTDNAVFSYTISTEKIEKLSSVKGLSGNVTSAIHYNSTFKRLVIGYENGLIEVVDEDNTITISADIVNFNQAGEKSINHISEFNNKLYLSTPFAIIEYDVEKLEFGDTFFIGNNSTEIVINETTIVNNQIYAATEVGVFVADVTSNSLIDFNNWNQFFSGQSFKNITSFNNQVFTTVNSILYKIDNASLSQIRDFSETIIGIKSSESSITVALSKIGFIFDTSLNQLLELDATSEFDFTLNNAFFDNNEIYLGTKEFGILKSDSASPSNYKEIHPDGPLSNDVFSITAGENNKLWVVYGGFNNIYGSIFKKQGYSNFDGEKWINIPYDPNFPVTDLTNLTIDPENENKVYISSFGVTGNVNSVSTGGLWVIEDFKTKIFYNHLNSTIESISVSLPSINIRINNSVFDKQGNLWITNQEVSNKLQRLSPSGEWKGYDLSSLDLIFAPGLSDLIIDSNNTLWMGTRRNGVMVFNPNGERKKGLTTTSNQGSLPDLNVKSLAVDRNNRIWIGTPSGLVVFSNASGVFDTDNINAEPVIILDDGIAKKLLGDQSINSIQVDGADNKWFGTDNAGVLYTNSNGQTTLANFSTDNSPLPSNKILKIRVDNSTGKVYFATDKGIVAYNSNVAPYAEELTDVYAYPNPALKNHQTVTIDGRNGTHLPKGTNVKIIDVSGNLVHETNVVEGQELQGGKVVWNKTNLAGRKVASGVYIVLLTNEDASETRTTKIAIVN